MDVVGDCCGGTEGVERGWRTWLLSVMDSRWRQLIRSSKMWQWAAKGALSLSGADAVFRAILDDASTNMCEHGGIGVLPVDDGTKVLPSRLEGLEAKSSVKVLAAAQSCMALGKSMLKVQTGYMLCPATEVGRGGPSMSMISLKALPVR